VEEYAAFLGTLRQNEPTCAQVLDRHGSDYFARLCKRVYFASLLEASNPTYAACGDVRERLNVVMSRVAPRGSVAWNEDRYFRALSLGLRMAGVIPGKRVLYRVSMWAFNASKVLRAQHRTKSKE
jgi:hypothetical protein